MRELIGFKSLFAAIALLALLAACKQPVQDFAVYKGPLVRGENITTIYSDSGLTKIEMHAPLQEEWANGDRTFPKGIEIWFFDKMGVRESRLTANKGKFEKMTEIYTGMGNVQVENTKERKLLKSEELKWNRFEKRVYTNKFVRIETPEEILLGDGLTAAQDFSTYKILKLRGTIPVSKI
jgi:LPS export ABC transporter protein LptC